MHCITIAFTSSFAGLRDHGILKMVIKVKFEVNYPSLSLSGSPTASADAAGRNVDKSGVSSFTPHLTDIILREMRERFSIPQGDSCSAFVNTD